MLGRVLTRGFVVLIGAGRTQSGGRIPPGRTARTPTEGGGGGPAATEEIFQQSQMWREVRRMAELGGAEGEWAAGWLRELATGRVAESTLHQYQYASRWNVWVEWCRRRALPPLGEGLQAQVSMAPFLRNGGPSGKG